MRNSNGAKNKINIAKIPNKPCSANNLVNSLCEAALIPDLLNLYSFAFPGPNPNIGFSLKASHSKFDISPLPVVKSFSLFR